MINIRTRRIVLGLTQDDLARLTGASNSTVRGWDRGNRPNRKWQEDLCRALGVDETQIEWWA